MIYCRLAATLRRSDSSSVRSAARHPMAGRTTLAELYKARGNVAAARKAEADLARTWIGDRGLLQISNL
jgi:hypothetical protein